jgi:hypothetical protein
MVLCSRLSRRILVLAAIAFAFTTPHLSIAQNSVSARADVGAPFVSQLAFPMSVRVDAAAIKARPMMEAPSRIVPEGEPGPKIAPGIRFPVWDPALQHRSSTVSPKTEAAGLQPIDLLGTPLLNFAGMSSGAQPPDTVIDVGPRHIVEMVNATTFQVWDKDGNDLSGGPLDFGGLWPTGNVCHENAGDPIVVYDHLADRWLLSQFASSGATNGMCIAISETPDPLPSGGFFLYTIRLDVFPDYPKFGVWADAYYMSSYEFPDLGVFAFDRQNMLNGQAISFVKFTVSALSGVRRDTRILPSDLDGPPPPDGTPNFFFRSVDDLQDSANPTDRLEVYAFHVYWANPAVSTFSLADTIDGASTPALAPFNTMGCNRQGDGIRDCIPQPDTNITLDALSNRPMMQLKFRAISDTDFRMVVNQTIDASGTIPAMLGITVANEVAGIRWYELQNSAGSWRIRQQGTYAAQPLTASSEGDLLHRWMGSIAMDRLGDIALGYSIANQASDTSNTGKVYPSIRYTGRSVNDPLGLIQQGEKVVLSGTTFASVLQHRWGDYSALTVDPSDGCTFWYANEVAGGATQIASFRFKDCRSRHKHK